MTVIELPTYRGFVDQHFLIEPLGGPKHPQQYTDRFPEDLYHLTPESHIVRFLSTLIGPAGVGWLRKQSFEARLILEAEGLDLFDLDRFYGDPFGFGRISEEHYEEDPTGVLGREEWNVIRSKDERYRGRAIDFFNGAKAGNTPQGMHLVARSGLGHECEIIENYKYLFDIHSDFAIGLPYYGQTTSLQEMVVLPRREVSRSEVQRVTITGDPTGGTFVLFYDGRNTVPLDYDSHAQAVQDALRDLPNIGANVEVRGDAPPSHLDVYFRGPLANQDVPELVAIPSLSGGLDPGITVETLVGGQESVDEIVHISAKDSHALQTAIDRIKPIGTIPTLNTGEGLRARQNWNDAFASSEFNDVIRYVKGNPAVPWPSSQLGSLNAQDAQLVNWIEKNVEKEAPRAARDLQYHYQGFHNVRAVYSYTEGAVEDSEYLEDVGILSGYSSNHIGQFGQYQRNIPNFTFLSNNLDDQLVFTPDRVLADYFEPLTVTSRTDSEDGGVPLINGIYPSNYASLPNIPDIRYKDEQFWASQERGEGDEYLEIDLGKVRAVNYLSFEVSKKPLDLEVSYDTLDQYPRRRFLNVVPAISDFPLNVAFTQDENPWDRAEFFFQDETGRIPLTRFIRIRFSRQSSVLNPFLYDLVNQIQHPWSVDVRNLRVGRNVSDF